MIWLPVVGNYADIDVYASVITYADLLNQRGKPAKTYIPVAPNYSVPENLRIPEQENPVFDLQPSDQAIILDLSDPETINRLVPDNQILELIDHHPGYEDYWHEHIGDKAILDNTLNFTAKITTERDHKAAAKLAELIDTSVQDFATWYFAEVSKTVASDLKNALLQDCKTVNLPTNQTEFVFCQLTLWSAASITAWHDEILAIMNATYPTWLVSILDISQNKNYIITSSTELSKYITELLHPRARGDWLVTEQLYLRKEIIGKMLGR